MNYHREMQPAFVGVINRKTVEFFADPNQMATDPWVGCERFCDAVGASTADRYRMVEIDRNVPLEALQKVKTPTGLLTILASGAAMIILRKMISAGNAPSTALEDFFRTIEEARAAIRRTGSR